MKTSLLLACCVALLAPATASARPLSVGDAVARTCQDRLLSGAAGTTTERYRATTAGVVTVTLAGRSGDWDLALFHPGGSLDTASATMGASERAVAYLKAGQELVAQACRRRGASARASLRFDLYPYTPPARTYTARLVHVSFALPTDLARLEETGVDVTHSHDSHGATVVLYSHADEARLRRAGFSWTTEVADLRKLDALEASKGRAFAAQVTRSALPSGRTAYRTYADYGTELKALVTQNPGLVRAATIGTSLENRPIEGVEIADAVNGDDGRPVFTVMGAHHAREWPSAEMPMEFALDLVKRYKAGEQRVVDLLKRVRVIALPIINPDGFVVSRGANGGTTTPVDDNSDATLGFAVGDSGAYKRKNCRVTVAGGPASAPCAVRQGSGVDLNRNYGAYWGGVGSSDDPTTQGYRGQGPYSEPESEAVHRLSSTRNITTIITHHTFTEQGVWLRQPGFCPFGAAGCQANQDIVPDEAGMKALGDSMAQASGWTSELGWAIGEITGATEDWNYFAAGAYGYTPEQRGPNFHPSFATAVLAEYDGTAAGAKGGVREALLRAAEQAADPRWHSVITGTAPAGAVLKLVKDLETTTSQQGRVVRDHLEFTTAVPASGSFRWHVNPSTRPLVLPAREHYLLRCEIGGKLVQARRLEVDRGQSLDLGADACTGTLAPGAEQTVVFGATPALGAGSSTSTTGRDGVPSARDLLVLSRRGFRASTLNRTRRIGVGVRVDGQLRRLHVRLVENGGRTVADGRLATIGKDRVLVLKSRRRARAGVHRVVATAIARDGIIVQASRRVLIRR